MGGADLFARLSLAFLLSFSFRDGALDVMHDDALLFLPNALFANTALFPLSMRAVLPLYYT